MKKILVVITILNLYIGCGPSTNETKEKNNLYKLKTVSFLKKKLEVSNDSLSNILRNIKSAEENRDFSHASKLKLNLNYMFEKKESSDGELIDRKYRALNRILKDQIHKYKSKLDTDKNYEKKERSIYDGLNLSMIYHPLVLNEVSKAFRDFGQLYINETLDNNGDSIAEQVEVPRPWSGYWYPFSNDVLYNNEASPLGKYDQLMRALNKPDKSRRQEESFYKGFSPASWEGLCDAWAVASVVTKEPLEKKTVMGVDFSIADLKALLTFSHLKYPYKQYGITYRGNAETDGTFQDIKPEAFHQIVVSVLSKHKRAVVIDDMAGIEIWNKPLYRYRWKVIKDPENEYAFLVKGYPWLVKERSKETDQPTSSLDIVAPVYSYRLFVDKKTKKNNKYLVVAGEWIGDSYKDHPDTIKVVAEEGDVGSHNKEFDKNIEIYKRYLLNS